MTDSVIVEYDFSMITIDEIKKRLENSGYKFTSLLYVVTAPLGENTFASSLYWSIAAFVLV
jgi:hypothetical protein